MVPLISIQPQCRSVILNHILTGEVSSKDYTPAMMPLKISEMMMPAKNIRNYCVHLAYITVHNQIHVLLKKAPVTMELRMILQTHDCSWMGLVIVASSTQTQHSERIKLYMFSAWKERIFDVIQQNII